MCADPAEEELPRCIPNPTWRFSVCMRVLFVCTVCTYVCTMEGSPAKRRKGNAWSWWPLTVLTETKDWRMLPCDVNMKKEYEDSYIKREIYFVLDPMKVKSIRPQVDS